MAAIGIGLAWAGSAAAGPERVSAVQATGNSVRFSVDVPEPRVTEVEDGRHRIDLEGYDLEGAAGSTASPVRVLLVAVPPSGEVRVRGGAMAWREPLAVSMAPVPQRIERGEPFVERYRLDRGQEGAVLEVPQVRLLGVSWFRNQRVAHVAVAPVRGTGAGVEIARRVDVEVEATAVPEAGAAAEDPDPFERAYANVIVNYEQGRAWRRRAAARREGARPGDRGEVGVTGAVDTSSVFAGRSWARIAIPATGFYRVTFGQVRNLAVFSGATDTPLDSLRLFTWPGVPVLPEGSYCDTCDYREVSIAVVDRAGDGLFNENEDYFYFHALGVNGWQDSHDPSRPDTLFLNHPYETQNYCFLTVSTADLPVPGPPRRISTREAAVDRNGSEITPLTFNERLHFEVDAEYAPDASPYFPDATNPSTYFWEKWFWRSLDPGRGITEVFDAPGADALQAARLRMRLWGLSARDTCTDDPFRADHLADVSWNSNSLGRHAWRALEGYTVDVTFGPIERTGNQVRLEVPSFPACPSRTDRVGLAWFDVFYARKFEPLRNELAFASPTAAGDYLFQLTPFTTDTLPRVFDVTDPLDPVELTGYAYTGGGGTWTLEFEASQTGSRHYRVLQDASIVRLATTAFVNAPLTSLVNLRSPLRRADYLVIFYDGFREAADLLTQWREDHRGFETESVPISALYDQFSGGRTDPAAIRNFLRTVYLNWELVPQFVTLLGDASYDFKNLQGRAPAGQPGTLVPSYENGWDRVVLRQFATDDWLLNVDNAALVVPDFMGGRIPVNDLATALDVARNKVMLYEDTAPLGEYRNTVMLIADDQYQGPVQDDLGWIHLEQTSRLDTLATPHHLDRRRVYLHTYPTEGGSTKPAAKADIKFNINDGILMFNYIGHGSPFKLSDESVFLNTDVGTLTNTVRLPIFVAASCDIGKYNDPTVQSLGELLLITPGRGAIAVVSATELALSGQNANLNVALYHSLFARDASGRYSTSVAEALLSAKSGGLNSQKYQLMADAAIVPNAPNHWADVALYDSAGTTPVAALERGRTLMFRGQVLDGLGGSPLALDGVASLRIEDSAPLDQAPPCSWCLRQPLYYSTPAPVFLGDVGMSGGRFEGRFVVPLEAKTGARARLRAYVNGSSGGSARDGVGHRMLQLNPGTPPPDDRTGPNIVLSFQSGSTTVKPDASLRIDLSDPHGILTTGHTPQNGIIVTIDDNTTNRVDVTSSFRYAADSYQAGVATFVLPNLAEGPHKISVSAADNLAAGLDAGEHRSTASIDFRVEQVPPLSITRAYLFPNPTLSGGPLSGGTFVVDAPGDSVNVLLRIYTVTGRLIRTLKASGGLAQVQMAWDGLDDEASVLANGLYLFKVHVNPREPDGTSSPKQKADAEGRFVIVNP